MKKLVSTTMAFLILLSLTACGGGTETPTQAPVSVTSTVTGDTVQIKVSNIQIDPDVKADFIKIKFEKAYSGADSVITIKNEKDEIISSVTVSEGMSEVEFDTTNVNLLGISTLRISAPFDIMIKDVAVMAAEAPVTTTEATTTEVTTTTEATTTQITTTTTVETTLSDEEKYAVLYARYDPKYFDVYSYEEIEKRNLLNEVNEFECSWDENPIEPIVVYPISSWLVRLFPAYRAPAALKEGFLFYEPLTVVAETSTGYYKTKEGFFIHKQIVSPNKLEEEALIPLEYLKY